MILENNSERRRKVGRSSTDWQMGYSKEYEELLNGTVGKFYRGMPDLIWAV